LCVVDIRQNETIDSMMAFAAGDTQRLTLYSTWSADGWSTIPTVSRGDFFWWRCCLWPTTANHRCKDGEFWMPCWQKKTIQ